MNDWNEGYFTDSTYTYGYYRELSPNFMRWCLLAKGIAAPEITEESFHCELGFGQGISANIHAAATPGKFFGTDFNPAHAAHAQELAKASDSGANFFEDSFEEFSKRDLPQFDSIGLHGIWTWVSAENRKYILETARRHLRSGGMLYNSYNCLPGWSPNAPLRELLTLYYRQFPEGNADKNISATMNFVEEFLDAEPLYLNLAPNLKDLFNELKMKNPHYIAHEYLNLDWDLMYFADVAKLCQSAKLDFAATANPIETSDGAFLGDRAKKFLGKVDNPIVREQLQDYFVNRQFRKDIFVRGVRKLSQAETHDKILSTRYVLLTPAAQVPLKMNSGMGELTLSREIYLPLLEYLESENFRPKNLHEYLTRNNIDVRAIVEAIKILVSGKSVMPCQSDSAIKIVKKSCDKLNAHLCKRAEFSDAINFLASPLTGCGVNVNRFQQIFLAQYKSGVKTADKIADAAWKIFSRQGQSLVRDGRTVSPEENLIQLNILAETFLTQELPRFKALLLA